MSSLSMIVWRDQSGQNARPGRGIFYLGVDIAVRDAPIVPHGATPVRHSPAGISRGRELIQ